MSKNQKIAGDSVEKELDSIKRLLILLLMKSGTPQGEIAKALDMNQGLLSQMMPARAFKPFERVS